MGFVYDSESNRITMSRGDTAEMLVRVNWDRITPGDVVIFAIFAKDSGKDLVCKPVEIVYSNAVIRLCNHDTRDIPAGRYCWNLRIVTDPEYDEGGNVRVEDCSDDVVTIFDKPPVFKLVNGGGYV